MRRIGWMLLQAAVFAVTFWAIYWAGVAPGTVPNGQDAGAAALGAIVVTFLVVGIINQIQNYLFRRRGSGVAGRVDLAEQPDNRSDRLGRSRPVLDEPSEIIEIPFREKTRKLLRPPS